MTHAPNAYASRRTTGRGQRRIGIQAVFTASNPLVNLGKYAPRVGSPRNPVLVYEWNMLGCKSTTKHFH